MQATDCGAESVLCEAEDFADRWSNPWSAVREPVAHLQDILGLQCGRSAPSVSLACRMTSSLPRRHCRFDSSINRLPTMTEILEVVGSHTLRQVLDEVETNGGVTQPWLTRF